MIVPERITVRVVADEAMDLSGIIVGLRVVAGRKNPYHIYFPKTDSNGMAVLTHADFVGQFADHWEESLMDYDGSAEAADSRVAAFLYDPSTLIAHPEVASRWPLLRHERTKWSSPEQRYRYYVSSRNTELTAPSVTIDLHETRDFVLRVNRKLVSG